MFTLEQFTNHAYRAIATVASKGRAAIALHALTTPGKVRIKNRKGKVILSGRIVADADTFRFVGVPVARFGDSPIYEDA